MTALSFEATLAYPGGFTVDAFFETDASVTALFGPSGSGKTSVVEIIGGARRPQHGRVAVRDMVVFDAANHIDIPPERRGVGAVFQDLLLFPHLNAEKNLRYGLRRRHTLGPAVDFDRVVAVLELGGLLRRPVGVLSGGERQRVALGRALLSRPRLLVMDEPLAALDERLKLRILGYLERALEEWAIPAVFVSHGQAEVRRLADRVIVMDAGKVVTAGTPDEALATPGVMALKNTSGPMNLLRVARVREQEGRWYGEVNGQQIQLPPAEGTHGGELYVQFAPDSVLLSRDDVPLISARNHLHGTVRQMMELPEGCFVGIDVGQVIWAEVTPSAVAELGLEKGRDVYCLIKTHSLRLVE